MCRDICNQTGNPRACHGTGYMHDRALLGDMSGVRDGYVFCQPNVVEQAKAEACNRERPAEFLAVAKRVFAIAVPACPECGAPPAVAPSAPAAPEAPAQPAAPQPGVSGKDYAFEAAMDYVAGDKLALTARLVIAGAGSISGMKYSIYRNGNQTWLVSTDAMAVNRLDGGRTEIILSFRDQLRKDVTHLPYRIEGVVTLMP